MWSCCPIVRQCLVHTIFPTNQNHTLFADLEIKSIFKFWTDFQSCFVVEKSNIHLWSGGAPGAVVAISRGWGLGTQIHCLYIVQHCNPCTDVQLCSVCILYSIQMHTYIQSCNGPRHPFQPFCFVILQKMWVCTTLRVQWCFVSKKVFEFPKKIKKAQIMKQKPCGILWALDS